MAGSRPSAAELAAIPRMGQVIPRVVSGVPTSAAKRQQMHDAIAASRLGQKIARNKRTIAKETASLRHPPAHPDADHEWIDGRSWRDLNNDLREFIRAASDWWRHLPAPGQDDLIDRYWRLCAKGVINWRAWRLEAENLKLSVVSPQRSLAEQQAYTLREQQIGHRYMCSSYLTGGW